MVTRILFPNVVIFLIKYTISLSILEKDNREYGCLSLYGGCL